MLPGKKYTPEDFLWMAWRRKWLIVIPAVLAAAGTFVWSYQLPNRYSSSATILVVPQRVPESMVRSTVTVEVAERLQTISQSILTRTRLERIIEEFNLYRAERETMIMEDIVEQMRTRDIKIDVASPRRGQDASHFAVRFESSQPRTAMQVAERLASMFVQENLEDRAVLADSTNQFLQAQLEDARRRLIEHEAKLEDFRRRNAGQLPGQTGSNLQMMQMTQQQIQANLDAANRERDRLAGLDTAMAEAIANITQTPAETRDPAGAPTGSPAQQLQQAQATLTSLERRGLKPTHPDIARMKRIITELELKVAEETTRQAELQSLALPETAANVPSSVASKIAGMRMEADQLRRSLENRKAEDERLRRVLASYNFRLEAAPKLESELTELMRDYGTLQGQYESLLKKSEESKLAVNLERRQIGEQFKIIEGARLPQRPISPNRARMNLMGLLAGLGFGLLIAGLLEYRDTTLKTDDDVVVSLALPVLAVIPAMLTHADRKRAKRRRLILAASASCVVLLAAAAVVAWRMNLFSDWIR